MIHLDLDGTLLDVRARYHAVYVAALDGVTPALSRDAYWALKREREPEAALVGRFHPDVDATAYVARRAALLEHPDFLRHDTLLPDAAEALDALRAAGESLALVTLRHDPAALRGQLDALGIAAAFARVASGAGPASPWSTKADLLRPFARPGEWMIGDTEADVHAGQHLGLRTCAVGTGIRSPDFLRSLNPTSLVPNLSEAVGVITRAALVP